MTALFSWLATYAFHSTLILGAVALVTTWLVRRDAWRETLWKLALLGGLLTATLQFALGVRPLVGRWELSETAVSGSGLAPRSSVIGLETRPREPARPGPRMAAHVSQPIRVTRDETSAPRRDSTRDAADRTGLLTWPALLLFGWGALATWGLGRLIHRRARLHRLLRDRREVTDPPILATVAQLRRHAGVWRPVRITTTARVATPFAIGASEICLPERALGGLAPDERRAAIAHELAHLARRDPHWQLVAGLMEAVFFFQPLNRLATRRLREAAEYLSDDWAVRQTESAMGLARCLAAVASWVAPEAPQAPESTVAMAEGGSPLIKRVERLLLARTSSPAPSAGARGLATVAILAAMIGAAPVVAIRTPDRHVEVPAGGSEGGPVRVHRPPDEDKSLRARFAWFLAQAGRRGDREVWIAYESRSVVPPNRGYGTDSQRPVESRARRSPRGVVFHSTRDRSRSPHAPDLVVLLRLRIGAHAEVSVLRAAGRTPTLDIEPEGLPVYWLAGSEVGESIAFLASLRPHAVDLEVQEKLVGIVALHRDPDAVVSDLSRILAGDHHVDVRAAAAEGLGWHPSTTVIERLRSAALGDRSKAVRREAVEALGETGGPEAEAALDEIIGSPTVPVGTRVEAVEALGRFRQPDVLAKLAEIAFGGYEREIQDEAVETVADLDLPEGLPVLEQVAFQHPDPKVRSEVVEPLAETGRSSDLETLFQLALTDPAPGIQLEATDRLADFRLVDAAPRLRRITWEHKSGAIRSHGLDLIAAMPESYSLPLLVEMAAGHPDDSLRRRALEAIGARGSERSARRLLGIALAHPDRTLRRQALDLLAGRRSIGSRGAGR